MLLKESNENLPSNTRVEITCSVYTTYRRVVRLTTPWQDARCPVYRGDVIRVVMVTAIFSARDKTTVTHAHVTVVGKL